jgi:hypothetical protein
MFLCRGARFTGRGHARDSDELRSECVLLICGGDPLEVRKTTRARRSYFRDVATGAFIFR